jgi:hypothetical protein
VEETISQTEVRRWKSQMSAAAAAQRLAGLTDATEAIKLFSEV